MSQDKCQQISKGTNTPKQRYYDSNCIRILFILFAIGICISATELKIEISYGAANKVLSMQKVESSSENSFLHQFRKRDTREDDKPSTDFAPPTYNFSLELLNNKSVLLTVEKFNASDNLYVIWFKDDGRSGATSSLDYNCKAYADPNIVMESLNESHTYTFCLMTNEQVLISPFNCQPLYVPAPLGEIESEDNSKQITIIILCITFGISTILGAVIAYYGLRNYPDLLKWSSNVLKFEEQDRTCFIPTITGYTKSLPEKTSESFNSILTISKSSTSTTSESKTSSLKSSSTCFEELISPVPSNEEYEIPKQFIAQPYESLSEPKSPKSPPPLPKRNSTLSFNKK